MNDYKKLLNYINNNTISNSLWIGENSPFDINSVNILTSDNFRLSSSHHGKYKYVWFYENLLSDIYAWRNILDELIRLIDYEGTIILRFEENENLSVINLKKFLFRNQLLETVNIIDKFEKKNENHNIASKYEHELILVLNIKRKHYSIYKNNTWTFTILTQGSKIDNVVQFCKSIRELEKTKSQIVIFGPKSDEYEKYNVEYIEVKYETKYANISEKKNDLLKYVKNENLMIVHDRYKLNDDFFSGFEYYGYDFDFLTIRQNYENKKIFPFYLKLEKEMIWSKIYYSSTEKYANSNVFLNGGLLIFKTKTLNSIGFNSLIFWDEGEDVELSNVMMEKSVIPRINLFSSSTTLGIDENYTSTFAIDPLTLNEVNKIKKSESYNLKDNLPSGTYSNISNRIPKYIRVIIKKVILLKYDHPKDFYDSVCLKTPELLRKIIKKVLLK